MSGCRRGQALAEFMVLIAIIVVYFIVFALIYGGQKAMQYQYTEMMQAKAAADQLSMGANAAFIAGNGTRVRFSFSNATMNITVAGNHIQIVRAGNLVESPLMTSNVTGSVYTGVLYAKNNGGAIAIG